jgi:hypothetical protein
MAEVNLTPNASEAYRSCGEEPVADQLGGRQVLRLIDGHHTLEDGLHGVGHLEFPALDGNLRDLQERIVGAIKRIRDGGGDPALLESAGLGLFYLPRLAAGGGVVADAEQIVAAVQVGGGPNGGRGAEIITACGLFGMRSVDEAHQDLGYTRTGELITDQMNQWADVLGQEGPSTARQLFVLGGGYRPYTVELVPVYEAMLAYGGASEVELALKAVNAAVEEAGQDGLDPRYRNQLLDDLRSLLDLTVRLLDGDQPTLGCGVRNHRTDCECGAHGFRGLNLHSAIAHTADRIRNVING